MEHASDNTDCSLKDRYSSCIGPPEYEHEAAQYCVLHLRSEDKEDDFKKALDEKFENQDFNFAGAFSRVVRRNSIIMSLHGQTSSK